MIKTAKEFEQAMYNLLKNIQSNKILYGELDFEIEELDYNDVLEEITSCHLVKGLTIQSANSENVKMLAKIPRVSYSGLKFMRWFEQENN